MQAHKQSSALNRRSVFILQSVIVFTAIFTLLFFMWPLPRVIYAELQGDFDYLPLLAGLYLPAVPFFIALINSFFLLKHIGDDQVFTLSSVKALRRIKISCLVVAGIFAVGMPYIFQLAQMDDAPGLVVVGLVIIGASVVVATAAAVFQQLLLTAIRIKSENDLTV